MNYTYALAYALLLVCVFVLSPTHKQGYAMRVLDKFVFAERVPAGVVVIF